MPDHLADAIAARLDELSGAGRHTLALLALLGRPMPVEMAGPGAAELERAGLTRTRGSHVVLAHRLLGELWIAQLEAAERRELHNYLAEHATDPGEAARHFAAAGIPDRAATNALAAARATAAPTERARLLEFAVQTAAVDVGVRIETARALLDIDDPVAAAAVLDTPGAVDVHAQTQLLRCLALVRAGDATGARAEAIASYPSPRSGADRDTTELLALEAAGLSVWPYWEPEQARAELARAGSGLRACAIAEVTEMQLGAEAAGATLPDIATSTDVRAAALATSALVLAARTDAGALAIVGRSDATPRDVRLALELLALVLAVHAGESDTTAVRLRALLDDPRLADREIATAHLALALADRGATGDALAVLEPVSDRSTPTGRATIAWARAEVELTAGRLRRAAAAAQDAIACCPIGYPAAPLAELIAGWIALESGAAGRPVLPAGPAPLPRAVRSEQAAIAAAVAGDHVAAAAGFTAATRTWAPRNLRNALRCEWGAADAHRRAGDRDAAIDGLTQVELDAEARGWRPLVARARASLRAAGVRRNPGRGPTTYGLTPREREVVTLVGSGLTSREIAQTLGIAASTVDTHAESAVRKLGARSRRHAAAMLGEPELV